MAPTIWSYYFLATSMGAVVFFVWTLWVHLFNESVVVNFSITNFGVEDISLLFIVDNISVVFALMTFIISSAILFYSLPYIDSDPRKNGFVNILSLFVTSMVILSFSGNLLSMIIGWDGLGITSFALIVFFQNWTSFNSGVVTFMTNRLGDVAIMISLLFTIISGVDWFWVGNNNWWTLLLLAGALTNSAQFPFSAWLPRAIAAPTPVSALVHSSTLVTAGVFVVIRFNSWLSPEDLWVLQIVSILSIFLAGISSLGEFDFNNIIALSTLSHISLIILSVSIGAVWTAMIHMFIHALFKSSLFMVAGWLIHSSSGEQDIRRLSTSDLPESGNALLLFSLISIAGFPFIAGFFSNEEILHSCVQTDNVVFPLVFFLAAGLTGSYSVRLLIYLTIKGSPYPLVGQPPLEVNRLFYQSSVMVTLGGGLIIPVLSEETTFESLFSSVGNTVLCVFIMYSIYFGVNSVSKWPSYPPVMWGIDSLSDLSLLLVKNSSYNMLFSFDVNGLTDLIFPSGSLVNSWSENITRLSSFNPSMIIEMTTILSIVIIILW